jgi:ferredoxin, 2Fe-2S
MTGRVHVEPIGVTFDLVEGESLMAAAQRAGYWWPTLCNGNAQCTRCVVRVIAGAGLTPPAQAELKALREIRWHGGPEDRAERLACQLKVADRATAEVYKRGVRLVTDHSQL